MKEELSLSLPRSVLTEIRAGKSIPNTTLSSKPFIISVDAAASLNWKEWYPKTTDFSCGNSISHTPSKHSRWKVACVQLRKEDSPVWNTRSTGRSMGHSGDEDTLSTTTVSVSRKDSLPITTVDRLGKSIHSTIDAQSPCSRSGAVVKLALSCSEPISTELRESSFSMVRELNLAKECAPIFSDVSEEQSVSEKEPSLRRKESAPTSTVFSPFNPTRLMRSALLKLLP